MASRVSEAALQERMEGSRVALRYDAIRQAHSEEMYWLATMESYVREALSTVDQCSSAELSSKCIAVGRNSLHFFWRRVLELAADLPWRLCRGDLKDNLVELQDEVLPSEPVSQGLWKLLHMWPPLLQLVLAP